jgi:hypothetical protein
MATKKKTKLRLLYIFKVRPNFNEILPAVSDIKRADEGQRDKETPRTDLNFTFELTVFNIPPTKFVYIRCLKSRCHLINNSMDEAMLTL